MDGEKRLTASLGYVGAKDRLQSETNGAYEVGALLDNFLTSEPLVIGKAKDLALRMARLSHLIRDVIIRAFEEKHASQTLNDLRQAFAKTLIPDLMEPGKTAEFADMYAQTIAYGLFAARCFDVTPQNFTRDEARHLIPKTNPFLRRLFDMISGTAMDDEPYAGFVDDLVQLLGRARMDQVLADFGRRAARQDPVVHFYETFLAAYDPALRKARGVYYTPEPVVSYIVRSVDHLLKTRFDCPQGVADTQTTTYSKKDEAGIGFTTKSPRVLILDPACGTGTFLYAVVDHIRDEFMKQGNAGLWSGYVRNNLLPRLFGFELLMAPYAVAHFKLGMALAGLDLPMARRKDWIYDFATDERLGVFMTNTLEEAAKRSETLFGPLRAIAEEADAAALVKRQLPIMVVMGNPPYAGHSANASVRKVKRINKSGKWVTRREETFIGGLLRDYRKDCPELAKPAQAKWLQDDYVKFLRFGQWRIEQTGSGILAFITNHGYLDNPTFRGMRQSLMKTFDEICVLDLHGNSKRKEKAPDGGPDKNVFDIQQGVAIALMVKRPRQPEESAKVPATVRHAELWGPREGKDGQGGKYGWLFEEEAATTNWEELQPAAPLFLFVPRDSEMQREYETYWRLPDIMNQNGDPAPGIVTTQDDFAISWSQEEAIAKVEKLLATSTEAEARKLFKLCSQSQWNYEQAKQELADGKWRDKVMPILYRPFDLRWTVYDSNVAVHRRERVMRNMMGGQTLGIATTRSVEIAGGFQHVLVSRWPIQHHTVSLKEINFLFPLQIHTEIGSPMIVPKRVSESTPNIAPSFRNRCQDLYGVSVAPEVVFNYIYAFLQIPGYRTRYAAFLKSDFPRVPLTSDRDLFRALSEKGGALVALHLLESSLLDSPITRFPVPGDHRVEKGYPKYVSPGRVHINAEQYFEGVPEDVWAFHIGGYQVAHKWLKDRQGRQLSYYDLTHYQKTITALHHTIRIMTEIDALIPKWPVP